MSILNFTQLEQHLGPLAYPLFFCSLVAFAILIERLMLLSFYSITKQLHRESLYVLGRHQLAERKIREEVAAIWLQKQQGKLAHGIRVLNIISLLAPLLGLLGTVIGLIQVFDSLGAHQGPIEPSLLAKGLGVAMKTTAGGLIIALPALLGAHGFQMWADRLIQGIEHSINIHNLELDGVCIEALA